MTKKLQTFVCFLALLLCGAVNSTAQSQQQDFAVVEQNGIYYALYLSQKTAQIVQGPIAKYYIEHNGDMSGYDYNAQQEIFPAYKGSVNVPASVFYQNETYKVTDINGLGSNPELTAVRVEAALTSLSLSNVPNLTSLELLNTESLTSIYLNNTGLSSLYIPEKVISLSFSQNSNLTNVEVSPENPSYIMYHGLLCNKTDGTPKQIYYIPEGMEGTLVIPEGITYCNFSLANCTKLTEVVIPSTLYDINTLLSGVKNIKITFSGDNPTYKYEDGFILSADGKNMIVALGSDAESLTIPDGVQNFSESIWAWSYYQKFPNLKILTLPASFQQNLFSDLNYYCYYLEQVIIKDGNSNFCNVNGMVMDIKRSTILCVPRHFQGSLTIPEGTSAIGSRAFYSNQRLTSVTLPNTVYVLDSEAFAWCSNLELVTLSDVSYKLEGNIFSYCSKLETVVIPQSVKALGTSMFQGCTSLKTITLPDVSTIPSNIFYNCRSLESITIPNTVTSIEYNAFANCVKLKDIKLSENLSSIGNYVFQSDSALVSLTLPAHLEKIGQAITRYCPQLEQIKVDPNNAYLCDIDGVIFSKDKKTLMHFPAGRKGSYAIPTGTETIGSYAFYECDSLKQITIPDGVVSLQNYAFGYLPLTELDLPASVTKIATNYALYYLQSLKKLIVRTSEKVDPYNLLNRIKPSSECVVYVNDKNFDSFKSYSYDISNIIIMSISKPYGIGAITKYLKGLSFKLAENELITNDKTLVSITAGNSVAVKQDNGTYLIKGLKTSTSYEIVVNYQIDGKASSISYGSYYTNSPSCKLEGTATQTTYTLKSAYFRKYSDITTGKPRKMSVTIKDKEYACKDNGYVADVPIKITGMIPGTSLPVTFNIQYEDGEELTMNSSISTQGFNPSLIDYKVTPTTLRLNYTYKEIDAVPDSVLLVIYDQVKTGTYSTKTVYDTLRTSVKENLFTGLIPGKQYKVSAIYLKNKGTNRNNYSSIYNYYSIINTFETPALTIITDTPKVPERGRAIVGATTNAGDGEGHVGFQWIKYNAPSTMQPYEAYGQVFNGTAQGQLKNLSQTYYKVRAFYDYIDGGTSTRIYANNGSDNGWITFDADEIGSFEPIIHTYDDVQPTNTTVQLKGVLFEGSENIIKQGFEYWETDNNVAARTVRRVSANREHQTIYITGDNLTAEITGLIPGTEYAYRAFAETASGVVYGEECAFKTNGERPTDTAIEEVVIENNEPKTFNVYSVSGAMVRHQATSLEGLPRGIYVVNKRKVFVK